MSCARCGSTISPVQIKLGDGFRMDLWRELCRACANVIAAMLRAEDWVPKPKAGTDG